MDWETQLNAILEMLGPHGIFSILAVIFFMRMIRVKVWLPFWGSLSIMIALSASIGCGTAFFALEDPTTKMVLGGGFMTVIGTPLAYEAIKWGIAFAYRQLGWEILNVLFFFISPKPIKIKYADGAVEEVEQPGVLTEYMDRREKKNAKISKHTK